MGRNGPAMADGHVTAPPAKRVSPDRSRSRVTSTITRRARSAASRSGDRRAPRCLEQVAGIEPSDSGVAHRCVTSTLHLLGGLQRDLGCEAPWRRGAAGAPRRCRHAPHERLVNGTRGFVLPPGVEPGPLGFQPSAQTVALRKDAAARMPDDRRAARFIFRCLAEAPHRHDSSVVRDHPPRFRGAPRASAFLRGHRRRTNRSFKIWSGNPDLESAKLDCIDHQTVSRCRGCRGQKLPGQGRQVRQRSMGSWSCRYGPERRRATWFPGRPSTQVMLVQQRLSGGNLRGRSYLRYRDG
jgi:hypothetical protein